MDSTMELSMTAIEMQFEDIEDFSQPTGMFDVESEIIPQTALIDMAFKGKPETVNEIDLGLSSRGRSLPDDFGDDVDADLDHFFDD